MRDTPRAAQTAAEAAADSRRIPKYKNPTNQKNQVNPAPHPIPQYKRLIMNQGLQIDKYSSAVLHFNSPMIFFHKLVDLV